MGERFWRYAWRGVTAVVAIAVIVLIVRPFGGPPDPSGDDIGTAWNKSVGRLGIEPLYPPLEDFHVGDIFAVIVAPDDATTAKLSSLNKSLRLGHIDLRTEIIKASEGRPLFEPTVEPKTGEAYRRQARLEEERKDPPRIPVTLAAFPGVSITHTLQGTGTVDTGFFGFGASRQLQQVEEIRIQTAETYGVPPEVAYAALAKWCKAADTAKYCANDRAARRLLAYAVNNDVLAVGEKGEYLGKIQLLMVTRVFMTREILQKRQSTDEASGNLKRGKAGGAPEAGKEGGEQPGAVALEAKRNDGFEFGLKQSFQRPLVFGYRNLNVALTQVPPEKANTP